MFTGLIEQTGKLESMVPRSDGARLTIRADHAWTPPLELGESVAVQGACLTVTEADSIVFTCDVLKETLDRTVLRELKPGAVVNLERALRLGDRLGGHLVSGHVDGLGKLDGVRFEGDDRVLRVACDEALSRGVVEKGSVALDGISLTVTAVAERYFEVKVIPWTWAHTSLHVREGGDWMNIETDMIGKYVQRSLASGSGGSDLGWQQLADAGFMD